MRSYLRCLVTFCLLIDLIVALIFLYDGILILVLSSREEKIVGGTIAVVVGVIFLSTFISGFISHKFDSAKRINAVSTIAASSLSFSIGCSLLVERKSLYETLQEEDLLFDTHILKCLRYHAVAFGVSFLVLGVLDATRYMLVDTRVAHPLGSNGTIGDESTLLDEALLLQSDRNVHDDVSSSSGFNPIDDMDLHMDDHWWSQTESLTKNETSV